MFGVNISSASFTLTNVSIEGVPITNCFRSSFVALTLKGKEDYHQKKLATVSEVGVPEWAIVLLVLAFGTILVLVALIYRKREQKDSSTSVDDDHCDKIQQQPLPSSTVPKTHASPPTRKRFYRI